MYKLYEFWQNFVSNYKNAGDYSGECERKDFVIYLVFMFLIYMLVFGILFFLTVLLNIFSSNINFTLLFVAGMCAFGLAFIIPYLALVKRRLNVIFKNKAANIFRIYLAFLMITLFVFGFMTKYVNSVNSAQDFVLILLPYVFISFLNFCHLGFIVFLMMRKNPMIK